MFLMDNKLFRFRAVFEMKIWLDKNGGRQVKNGVSFWMYITENHSKWPVTIRLNRH